MPTGGLRHETPQFGLQDLPDTSRQGKSALAISTAVTGIMMGWKALGALGRRFESCRPD